MGLFRRRPATDPAAVPGWQALRAANPEVPPLDGWSVAAVMDLPEAPGARLEVWTDVRDPAGEFQYGAALVPRDGSALEVCLGGVRAGTGFIVIHGPAESGRQGPLLVWRSDREWAEFAVFAWSNVLERRAQRGDALDPTRERIEHHQPLQAFFEANQGFGPRLISWRIIGELGPPEVPAGCRVELWSAIVADGPITYPAAAAGYRADGSIAAIASLEGMPGTHGDCFLGLFVAGEGMHRNLGERPDLLEGDGFPRVAVEMLGPYLA